MASTQVNNVTHLIARVSAGLVVEATRSNNRIWGDVTLIIPVLDDGWHRARMVSRLVTVVILTEPSKICLLYTSPSPRDA